jgi:hypothetical protein
MTAPRRTDKAARAAAAARLAAHTSTAGHAGPYAVAAAVSRITRNVTSDAAEGRACELGWAADLCR